MMNEHILVIDDSPTIGRTVGWVLNDAGYATDIVSDGLSALTSVHNCHPDLIILDIRLPHVDGIQICTIIRGKAKYADTPIIMLSGISGTDMIQKALDAGADDYLVKPIGDEQLLAVVAAHLDNRHIHDPVARRSEQ